MLRKSKWKRLLTPAYVMSYPIGLEMLALYFALYNFICKLLKFIIILSFK